MPSKETVYGKEYQGRLKYTYTMPNGVNPIMSELLLFYETSNSLVQGNASTIFRIHPAA
jgi:hypothetical protein